MFEQRNCHVKIAQIFTAHETIDEMGRKGQNLGSFFDKTQVEKAAKNKGAYGGAGAIETQNILLITDANGKETAFALREIHPIDLSHVKTEAQCNQVDNAMAQIESLGLSKDALKQLASRIS